MQLHSDGSVIIWGQAYPNPIHLPISAIYVSIGQGGVIPIISHILFWTIIHLMDQVMVLDILLQV